jgi:D-alanyl-D-alanine endopeptidase (penicillin-binding protein 7)
MRRTLPFFLILVLGALTPQRAALAVAATGKSPGLRSQAVLVMDRDDSSIIYSQKADLVAPIASITKLMTALVILDGKQSLDEVITVTDADRIRGRGAFSRIAIGAKIKRGDLLRLALMSSENRAAHVLGRSYPGGYGVFVRTMNLKAQALGMKQSRFVDPAGLSSDNVASSRDLAKLIIAASRSPVIRDYSTTTRYAVPIGKKLLEFHNTNVLVRDPNWDIAVQKTGYISEAGQCLVLQARISGRDVVIVLLNSFGKYTRVADARRIRQWMERRPQGPVSPPATATLKAAT